MENTQDSPRMLFYGPHWYDLDPQALETLKTLKPYRPVLAWITAWASIVIIVQLFLHFPKLIYLYPVVAFLIAGRIGVFFQLIHEASHGLVFKKSSWNHWFERWLTAYPVGLDLDNYNDAHERHHAFTNQAADAPSDVEKYRLPNIKDVRLWLLFLRDLLGLTAIVIQFKYAQASETKNKPEVPTNPLIKAFKKFAPIALVQFILCGALFGFNLSHYVFFWIIPLITAHMFLMRIRGIAEHGLGIQMERKDLEEKTRGAFYTRSCGTPANQYAFRPFVWIERLLIGSLSAYYHHEHHLYPTVPYYNLKKIHQKIGKKVKEYNPYVYAKGYFECLFFNLYWRSSS